MRWYTAVGVKMEHLGGLFCVQVGTENKILSGIEIFIWNALLWSFVEETQIYGRMVQLLKAVFPEKDLDGKTGKDEFNFCFRRLITRGLIIFCECETEKEAAENLLQNAIVARVMRNSGERFLMFCESFACGTPFWKALRVFKKEPMEERYGQFLLKIEKCGEVRYYLETTEQPNEILEMLSLLYQKKILFIRSVKEVTIES